MGDGHCLRRGAPRATPLYGTFGADGWGNADGLGEIMDIGVGANGDHPYFFKKISGGLGKIKIPLYLHPVREHSSAGSEHLPYKQRVTGSNPVAPTITLVDFYGGFSF